MCLNAGGMGRQDYETETLIPTTGAVFDVAHTLRAEGFDASEDGSGRGTPLVPVAYQTSGNCGAWETGSITGALDTGTDPNSHVICFSAKDYGADAAEIAPTLRSMGHDTSHPNGGGQVAVAFDTTQITSPGNYSNPRPGDPSHPLTSGGHPPTIAQPFSIMPMNSGKDYKPRPADVAQPFMARGPVGGNQGGDYVAQAWAVRRLTPRECERLQGFPDDFTAITYRGKPAADGPRYKALGNSMAVNVMRWIGERIAYVEAVATGEAA